MLFHPNVPGDSTNSVLVESLAGDLKGFACVFACRAAAAKDVRIMRHRNIRLVVSPRHHAFGIFRVAIQVATRPRKGTIPPGVDFLALNFFFCPCCGHRARKGEVYVS
jgi:hypothetical protein